MRIEYPKYHYDIVKSLLAGKFILFPGKLYKTVLENKEFYTDFFNVSFGYELITETEFVYLISDNTDEKTSRDIMTFISILAFEIDKEGKNFIDELNSSFFNLEKINQYFENSHSWHEIIKENKQINSPESRKSLIYNTMLKRNLIEKIGDNFQFTKAHKVFLNFALEFTKKDEKIESTYPPTKNIVHLADSAKYEDDSNK